MDYLSYFKEIAKIPHGSGNTQAISDYLKRFATDRNLECYQDKAGNIVIIKEASAGMEDAEPVILQGHMDMVAVSDDDYEIDMTKEGLTLEVDGDYLYAKGTSLGGDDGIAVAYALALLDSNEYKLPRLEVIITVDEEVGMLGAAVLDLSMLKGHTMLNLDSEDEGIFLTSCAGGARIDLKYELSDKYMADLSEGIVYDITFSNLIGGHSGCEIDKGRANAIVLMGELLKKLDSAKFLIGISYINGGTADNAIPNFCTAQILCKPIEPELFEIMKFEVLENYLTVEKNATITLSEVAPEDVKLPMYRITDGGLNHFLTALPNGIIAMSRDCEGLVETSLNQGLISMKDGFVNIGISIRSSIDERKEELLQSVIEIATTYKASFSVHGDYPGWAYRADSPIREKIVSVYKEQTGKEPTVMAIHAGLECGLLAKKINNLDCVSFGPDMIDIHTTREKLSLSSAERTWKLLLATLTK